MAKLRPWKTLARQIILNHGKFLVVEDHTIELPDGEIIEHWPWVIIPGAAIVLALTQEGEFVCFRQTKYAVEGLSLAPVGGMIEPGEIPLCAAKRELLEETGYVAENWVNLGKYCLDPNRGVADMHLFLAQGAKKVTAPDRDDLEDMELLLLSRAEIESALEAGEFKVISWSAVVALALQYLDREKKKLSHPPIESHLPQLMEFVSKLAQEYQAGKITSWDTMQKEVFAFFTPEMMEKVENIVPGWGKTVSYSNGLTLLHTTTALTALLLCPEFKSATPSQQSLMKWVVLLHDIGKEANPKRRDLTHSFRSAALTGEILPRLGFSTTSEYDEHIKDWVTLTKTAIIKNSETGREVQDNQKLPQILAGIENIFGFNTPAALIIKTILFHASITAVKEWPKGAPLTEIEIDKYFDDELLFLIKIMALADSASWSFFNLPRKESYREEVLETYRRIKRNR